MLRGVMPCPLLGGGWEAGESPSWRPESSQVGWGSSPNQRVRNRMGAALGRQCGGGGLRSWRKTPMAEGHYPSTEGFLWSSALFPPFSWGDCLLLPPHPSSTARASVFPGCCFQGRPVPPPSALQKQLNLAQRLKMRLLLGSAGGWIQDGRHCCAPPPQEAGGQVALPALLVGPSRLCGRHRQGPAEEPKGGCPSPAPPPQALLGPVAARSALPCPSVQRKPRRGRGSWKPLSERSSGGWGLPQSPYLQSPVKDLLGEWASLLPPPNLWGSSFLDSLYH